VTILAGFVIGIIALAVLVSALVCVWAVILDHCAAEADRMAEALTPEPMDHTCPHGLPVADCFFNHTYGPDVDAVYRSEQGETETQAERLP
jgi:hypothetical protein